MTNGQRAEKVIKEYGFDFDNISKEEIINLIENEEVLNISVFYVDICIASETKKMPL